MADLRHTPKTYHSFMKARKVATASRHRFLYAIVFAEFMQDNYGYNIRVSGRKCGDVYYGFDSHGIKTGPGFMISVYRPPRNGGDQERYFPMNVSVEDMEKAFHNFARNLIFNRIPTNLQIPGWERKDLAL